MEMTSTVATDNNFTYTFTLSGGITATASGTATLATPSIIGASFTISSNTFVNSNIVLQLRGQNATTATMTIDTSPNPYLYFKRNEIIYPSLTPIGSIMPYGGVRPPFGYLFCDGTFYVGTGIFADLFSVIGNVYGGSTSASFAVPDLKSRFPVGTAATSIMAGLGTNPVPSAATKQGGSSTIAEAQLPSHTHANTVSVTTQPNFGATASVPTWSTQATTTTGVYKNFSTGTVDGGGGGNPRRFLTSGSTLGPTILDTDNSINEGVLTAPSVVVSRSANAAVGITNAAVGSGTAYWQPHTAVNYIIKY